METGVRKDSALLGNIFSAGVFCKWEYSPPTAKSLGMLNESLR